MEFEIKVDNFDTSMATNPEIIVELLFFIKDVNQTDQVEQSQAHISNVDNESKLLEVIQSNNQETQTHKGQEEWLKESEEPNTLAYIIFDSKDYSKYFAKNQDWIHIRYVILSPTFLEFLT